MKKSICFALGICLFFTLSSVSAADHLTIPAGAFKAHGKTLEYANFGEYVTFPTGSGGGWMYAQVHLPDGMYVKNIRAHYYDNAVDGEISIYFSRMNHWSADPITRTQVDVFQIDTGIAAASHLLEYIVDSTHNTQAAHRLVQNNNCTYWVAVNVDKEGSELRLYSIQIEYTLII